MNYRQTLQAVDTLKGLALLGIEGTSNGSYIAFPCPKCQEKAVFKAVETGHRKWYRNHIMRGIDVSSDLIREFCRRHHIRRLSFFGSVLREDFGPDSDVDVLVEFEPGHVPGLKFFAIERELSDLLNRRVDLNTVNSLSKYFRDRVIAEAESLYVSA